MPLALLKAAIIGALLALLAGCGSVRFLYGNGSTLAWWWIDGYVDFPGDQAPPAKAAIERWFEWHRTTQLAPSIAHLAAARAQVMGPTTPEAVCRWQAQAREIVEPALQRALEAAADAFPGLGDAQWRHVEQRFAKNNAELERDFLQPDADERARAAAKRTIERVEMIYGDLDDGLRRVVFAGVSASPFDPRRWLDERVRRQRDTVQVLRRLSAERAGRDRVLAALRDLVERSERSPDPDYHAYQQRLAAYNCAFIARIHNAASPAQRAAARERLLGWENDLRGFLPAPATAAPP